MDNRVKAMSKKQLVELTLMLLHEHPEINQTVAGFLDKNCKEKTENEKDILWNYWRKVKKGIPKLYGRYDNYALQDELEGYIIRIVDMLKNPILPLKEKKKLITEMMNVYFTESSGIEEDILEYVVEMCSSEEEYKHFIQLLEEFESEYHKKLIASIYREHLNDEEVGRV